MNLDELIKNLKNNTGVYRQKENPTIPYETAKAAFKTIGDAMLRNKRKTFDLEPVEVPLDFIIKWLLQIEDGSEMDFSKGILIKGHTGRGKTQLFQMIAQFNKLAKLQFNENGKVKFINPVIVNVKQISGEYQDQEKGGNKTIQKYAEYNCLVLDDIGIEPAQSSSYGNNLNVVEEIINIREEKGKLTFGTTNLNRMNEMYDDRTISRMHQLFNTVEMNHKKDFRKE